MGTDDPTGSGLPAILTASDLAGLDWGDATFSGYRWEEGGTLRLYLRHGSLAIRELACSWASDFEGRCPPSPTGIVCGGPLLTWSGSIARKSADRWAVSFDFGKDGELSFECTDVTATAGEDN